MANRKIMCSKRISVMGFKEEGLVIVIRERTEDEFNTGGKTGE